MKKKRLIIFLIFLAVFVYQAITAQAAKPKEEKKDKSEEAKPGKKNEYTGYKTNRDPFGLPDSLAKLLTQDEAKDIKAVSAVKVPSITLQGIISSRGMRQVIINNNVLKIGEYVGDFEIKDILQDRVILFYKGKEYTVTR
ncbi:MAG: general secretion pathway protein GspB [Candidatus Omnitrophica bacterium]|nr:general secretion pathway protein GspB [Candidatus Omnitrophota bacterium]